MFVADVTDMAELESLMDEACADLDRARGERDIEQAKWDIEDIEERMAQLKG